MNPLWPIVAISKHLGALTNTAGSFQPTVASARGQALELLDAFLAGLHPSAGSQLRLYSATSRPPLPVTTIRLSQQVVPASQL